MLWKDVHNVTTVIFIKLKMSFIYPKKSFVTSENLGQKSRENLLEMFRHCFQMMTKIERKNLFKLFQPLFRTSLSV